MTKWPTVRAGDVLKLVRRAVELEPTTSYTEVGVRSFGRGLFHKPPVTGLELGRKRVFELGPGELVINIVFAWEGAVALSGASEVGTIGSHRFLTYQGDPSRVDVDFVRAYLVSEAGREALTAASPGSAGRNRTLSQSGFEDLIIPLPPLDGQRRIVQRLSQATLRMDAIQNRARVLLKRTDSIRRQTLSRASDAAASVSLGELVTPATNGVDVRASDTYRIGGIYSFGRGVFERAAIQGTGTKYPTLYRLGEGQFVYSKLKAWEGALAVVSPYQAGLHVSSEFPTFDVNRARIEPGFLRCVVTDPDFVRKLAATTTGIGARRDRVSPTALLATRIDLPNLDVQREVVEMHEHLDRLVAVCARQTAVSAALRPAMLNEVFSGRM